jgi:glycosyl transferase family 25
MKSYIIRLSDFPNSVEWAEKAYNSAINYDWDIEYFEGVNGQNETLLDHNLKVNSKYKKAVNSLERVGTVGCFLSHYKLWQRCIELNLPICILEHDVTIHKPFPELDFKDVIKLASGPKGKNIYIGEWWAGAMAYCVRPQGATKLVNFVETHGAMPADTMLCTGIVDLQFYNQINTVVTYVTDDFSFTWNL